MSLTTQDVNYHRLLATAARQINATINNAMTDDQDHCNEKQENNSDVDRNGDSFMSSIAFQNSNKPEPFAEQECSSSSLSSQDSLSSLASSISITEDNKAQIFLYDKSNFNYFQKCSFDETCSEDYKDPTQKSKCFNVKTEDEKENDLSNNNNSKSLLILKVKKPSSSSLSETSVSSSTSLSSADCPNSSMDDECLIQLNDPDKPLNRRQWYQLWLPSYKSRLNQFQKQFNDKISSREKLIDDFVCAIQRELLLQGRMYVSLNYISFYSNIFGYETIINISYQDIDSISKASTVRLFPNAIQIVTNSGLKYFFTSFVSRERAFRLITRLWHFARQEQPMPWPEIRKLIRESYTTNGLGIDLSDIDDANAEIDLSKKIKKKKHSKRKINGNRCYNISNINSSSELTNHEDGEEELMISKSSSKTHNADVQTDNDNYFFHSDHQCSLITVLQQLLFAVQRKLVRMVPTQLQVIRILFLLALILFVVQIGIYLRFISLNRRLLYTQQLLIKAIEEQQNNYNRNVFEKIFNRNSVASITDNFCYLNSETC